jgi:2-phospho-L-lactate/phosphoenolpyruvate guanylyltransferase
VRCTSLGPVQATVSEFDPQTRGGAVLLDDGVRLPFGPQALAGSRLRLLRRGQRVEVSVDAGVVTALQILTLHG